MSDLDELYQEIVLEHNKHPANFRKLDRANRTSEGYNPICGDRITLYLELKGDVVLDIGFQGSGCAISRASASMMTESIKGKSGAEAETIFNSFHQMVTRDPGSDFDNVELGDLEMLAGLSEFPVRVKCATLSWHTMRAALAGQKDAVYTE